MYSPCSPAFFLKYAPCSKAFCFITGPCSSAFSFKNLAALVVCSILRFLMYSACGAAVSTACFDFLFM